MLIEADDIMLMDYRRNNMTIFVKKVDLDKKLVR